jgi:hypothetical protein
MTVPGSIFGQFETHSSVIYVLNSSFNISYCNAAWDEFALRNGGARVLRKHQAGRNALDAAPQPLRPFYERLFSSVLRGGGEKGHLYECSSDEKFRRFHMHVMRKDVPGEGLFLVIVNSLVLEKAHDKPKVRFDQRILRQENGLITMCSHCRRVNLPKVRDGWVWVPEVVAKMPQEVSHSLCPVCFDVYYNSGQ